MSGTRETAMCGDHAAHTHALLYWPIESVTQPITALTKKLVTVNRLSTRLLVANKTLSKRLRKYQDCYRTIPNKHYTKLRISAVM